MEPSRRLPEVTVRLRANRRIASRHPWVFADDVSASNTAAHGDLVRVRDNAGMVLGIAFWSSRSKIALRMVSLADVVPDAAFWATRVDLALSRAAGPRLDAGPRGACSSARGTTCRGSLPIFTERIS